MLFARSIDGGFGEFLEQGMGLAVDHPIALLDGRLSDGLGKMTLPAAGWTEKQSVFMAGDEGAGGQIEDQTAIHLLVEIEVEVVEGPLWIAKLGLLAPSFQQSVAATREFVRDQAGEEVDGSHGFGLSLVQTRFEHRSDSAEPQLP